MGTETLSPDALLTQTNLTGALSDLTAQDANWLTADSNNADSVIAVSFPTPSGNPDGTQTFTVQFRVTANAASTTFDAYLTENGTRINGGAAIDSWTSTSTTGVARDITWNASLLGTADGSAVGLEVVATKTGGSPSNRTTGEFGFVDWDVTYAEATTPVSNTLDLRWDIEQAVSNTIDLRWDVLNAVSQTTDLRWDVLNAVSNTSTLQWDIKQAVSKTLELQWDMEGSVSNTLSLQWDVLNSVSQTADLRWDVLNAVSQTLALQWDIVATTPVFNTIQLRWRISGNRSADSGFTPVHGASRSLIGN